MRQVDLKLRGAGFLDDCIDLKVLGLCIVVDVLNNCFVFVNGR